VKNMYSGICEGGPFNGQALVHHSHLFAIEPHFCDMPLEAMETIPLTELETAFYEFTDGKWVYRV
jgi:hypothetical protein